VLVEFAHTLGTDFSLADILDRLVRRVVDVLPVTGAGVMLMETDGELHFVAASNSTIHQIEALQREYNEGPCIESFRTGQPVAVPDLSTDQTFPQFSPHAFEAGLAAVFTFPLQFEQRRLGALDLYRDQPGDLEDGDMHAAQVLADVAAAYLSNARARKEASEHLAVLRHDTLHDALTGLPNRTLFAERLNHAVAGARRSRLPVAVLFVDLDRFKAVNDRFGHRVGDLLLKLVSDRLTRCLRPGDTLARFAGDEFMILCENLARPSDAEGLAHRIGVALRDPFVVHGRPLEVTASVASPSPEKGGTFRIRCCMTPIWRCTRRRLPGEHRIGSSTAGCRARPARVLFSPTSYRVPCDDDCCRWPTSPSRGRGTVLLSAWKRS
jgi:diguanylate cyclase (GGDEF)-like protein